MLNAGTKPEQDLDDLLVVRSQARDQQAFGELVRRWEPPLYYYLRRLIEDESAVWDVLQNTWLAVFRHLSRLEDSRRFRSWVYRIAHDQAVNWWQKEKRYVCQPNEEFEPMVDCETTDPAPTEDVALLHRGLLKLSPLHREVLTLFYLEDFSSAQVAEVVGLPEGTVKSRLHNARKRLAEALKECGYARTQ
jgi:RNA polymerase sigma-70 factor (ECF subfamily)